MPCLWRKRQGGVRMTYRVWIGLGLLGLGASIGAPAWGADQDQFDKAAKTVNDAALTSGGAQQVAGKIASELNAACACTTFSGASVTAQRAQTGWGWGETLIANRLALAISQQSNVPFATALGQVTTARQTTGWGAIARANNLNVGQLASGVTKSANAVATAASNPGKGQGTGKGGTAQGHGAGVAAGHAGGAAGGGPGGGP